MAGYDFNAPVRAFVTFRNRAHRHDEDKFMSSLVCVDAASRGLANVSVVASGAFAALPAELIDAICIELLIGWSRNQGQSRTTRHYASLVIACRWVRALVSRRVALEAKCIHLVQKCYSLPVLPPEASYVEYAKVAIRSRIEVGMLYRYVRRASFHCVDPTAECCRGLRASLNEDWVQAPVSTLFKPDSLGAEALRERVGRRAIVVAPAHAQLLCATPDGALLCNDECVWSVTSKPAEEFAPGYELATAFSTPLKAKRNRVWGASQGKRIAVCESPACLDDVATVLENQDTLYSLRIFDDDRLIAETMLSNQGAAYTGAGEPHSVWIHDGAVWLLWLHKNNDACQYVRLVRVHPHEVHTPEKEWLTTTYTFENVISMSVATDAGHVAILYSRGGQFMSEVELFFFDVDALCGRDVPTHWRLYGNIDTPSDGIMHTVALSPDGTRMVLLDRSFGSHLVVPYVRDHKSQGLEHHGWRAVASCAVPEVANRALKYGLLKDVAFTPCGRRFFAFFAGPSPSENGVLEVGLVRLMSEESRQFVLDHCRFTTCACGNYPDIPGKVVWSNDGLFLQTIQREKRQDSGGVLRLGLVA